MKGKRFEFKDKTPGQFSHDGIYEVLDEGHMKNPVTREWQEAVIYTRDGKVYIREKQEFLDKFKIIL